MDMSKGTKYSQQFKEDAVQYRKIPQDFRLLYEAAIQDDSFQIPIYRSFLCFILAPSE